MFSLYAPVLLLAQASPIPDESADLVFTVKGPDLAICSHPGCDAFLRRLPFLQIDQQVGRGHRRMALATMSRDVARVAPT